MYRALRIDDRVDEVLVEVVDELGDAVVHPARHRDVVEHRQVLHQLAQADAAGVRTERHPELRRHAGSRRGSR